jgi:hypothetical protein
VTLVKCIYDMAHGMIDLFLEMATWEDSVCVPRVRATTTNAREMNGLGYPIEHCLRLFAYLGPSTPASQSCVQCSVVGILASRPRHLSHVRFGSVAWREHTGSEGRGSSSEPTQTSTRTESSDDVLGPDYYALPVGPGLRSCHGLSLANRKFCAAELGRLSSDEGVSS